MISFITPARNEEKGIAQLVDCLNRYTGAHEVIISDDGSTDNTVAIAAKHGATTLLYDGPKKTIAAARNRGAAGAHGEYFVFIDADMQVANPDAFFKKALAIFESRPEIVGVTSTVLVLPELETTADRVAYFVINSFFWVMNNGFGIGAASGEFQMVRAEAFRALGGYNEQIVVGEDQDLFRRLRAKGKTRFEPSLIAYNDGRRPHQLGWPKLFWSWWVDISSVWFKKESVSKVWKEVR